MNYSIPARCPCCQAPLTASVTVEDAGGDPERGHRYAVNLELEPVEATPNNHAEACAVCDQPATSAEERQACAERRSAEQHQPEPLEDACDCPHCRWSRTQAQPTGH